MPGPRSDDTISLVLGGDTMLGRGVAEVIGRRGPAYPLDPVADVTRGADLCLVNLECAFTSEGKRYAGPPKRFYFHAPPVAVETLRHAGVDGVALANNHALDAGVDGLRETLALLDDHGIAHAGAGTNVEKATRPAFLEAGGTRVGVLACCDHQEDFAAAPERPGICYVDIADAEALRALGEDVSALAQEVDYVVVAFHWQPNWAPQVEPGYRDLARSLVEAGASVVWGHSPHHFQGVEFFDDSVVLYSTGDLVDDYAVDREYRNDRQLLFQCALGGGISQVRAHPIELDFGRTHPADAEARQWIVRRFTEACAALDSEVIADEEGLIVRPRGVKRTA